MSCLARALRLQTFAFCLSTLLPAATAAAADLPTLQAHAQGRRALVEGDLPRAQAVWDSVLANRRGALHAISLERTCDRADLAAALGRRRSLSPVWVAGGECATLLWGAFDSAAEAQAQLDALPAGVLPSGARVVELRPPLGALSVDAPPPAPVTRVAVAQPEPEPPAPPMPRVEAPSRPAVEETPPEPEPVRVLAPEPEPVAQEAEPEPAPREVVPEPVPPAPEPEPVPVETKSPEPAAPARVDTRPPSPAPASEPPAEPPRQRRVKETPPPLPVEPEGLTDEERERRRVEAAASFAEGNALWAGGDYQAAIAAFETALELDPNNPRILNNLGTAWLKAERPERAVAVLQRAVELDALYARAYLNLSTALYASEQPQAALVSLQRVIDLEPSNLDARYNKAAVLAELRQWSAARDALVEGLDIAPGDPRLMEFLRQVDQQIAVRGSGEDPAPLAQAGAPGACDGIVSDVLRARRAGELFNEGVNATRAGDWAAAESAYIGVLDCDPTSSAAANRLGVARLQRGDAGGARQAFALASRLDPEHLEARANACLATFASESCDSATRCLQRLTSEAAGFGPGWREYALMLYRCSRTIEAESAAVRGLELSPDDARLKSLLARIQGERIGAPR